MVDINISKKLGEIMRLLGEDAGRFANYQDFPDFMSMHLESNKMEEYTQTQIPIDSKRYEWLLTSLECEPRSVVEIGASIGYFSLSLVQKFNLDSIVYEPIRQYSRVCRLISEVAGVDKNIACYSKGIGIDELSAFDSTDLMINLNVLHHAGSVYDLEQMSKMGSWIAYVEKYLHTVSLKSSYLFFQTGNTAKGEALFKGEEAIPIVEGLLRRSGWEIINIGAISDYNNMTYKSYDPSMLAEIPKIYCSRNLDTGLVDYFENGSLIASMQTGMAQRPLWFCRSKNT